MSRSQEIKEKQALLAKFQHGFGNSTSKVLEWIDGSSSVQEQENKSKDDFFQLPVIQIGSGLSFSDTKDINDTDIHTIGEFIKGDKKVSSLAKKKRTNKDIQERNSVHRVRKDDSQAMVSLKNKIRNQQRQKIRNELPKDKKGSNNVNDKKQSQMQLQPSVDAESSSDEEADIREQKHNKKKTGLLLFTGKKSKR